MEAQEHGQGWVIIQLSLIDQVELYFDKMIFFIFITVL